MKIRTCYGLLLLDFRFYKSLSESLNKQTHVQTKNYNVAHSALRKRTSRARFPIIVEWNLPNAASLLQNHPSAHMYSKIIPNTDERTSILRQKYLVFVVLEFLFFKKGQCFRMFNKLFMAIILGVRNFRVLNIQHIYRRPR